MEEEEAKKAKKDEKMAEEYPSARIIGIDDIYRSMNLALMPDISVVGSEFYTLAYEIDLEGRMDPRPKEEEEDEEGEEGSASPARRESTFFGGAGESARTKRHR